MMVNDERWFDNRDDAQSWADRYLERYPYEGYGTRVEIEESEIDVGVVKVFASRFRSCD